MASVLVPCTSCARHVRASETACPFCGAALPSDLGARAVPPATRRLNRIAVFTFAASVAIAGGTSAVGCGGAVDTPGGSGGGGGGGSGGGTADAAPPADDGGGPGPMYGLPAYDAGARDAASVDGGPDDDGGAIAMYGLPAPVDAGKEDTGVQPLYGLPPPEDGG